MNGSYGDLAFGKSIVGKLICLGPYVIIEGALGVSYVSVLKKIRNGEE